MKLIHGDCLKIIQGIKAGSIDAIIADPPYGVAYGLGDGNVSHGMKGKTAWDIQIDHTLMLNECNRILRVNGALLLFGQDPYTGKLMTDTHGNLPFSYRLTWLKDHFANALIAKKAPVSYTEDICVFFKKYDTLNQHPLREYAKTIMGYCNKTLKQINNDLGHRKAEHFFYIDSTQFNLCTEETYNELIKKYELPNMFGFKSFDEMKRVNKRFNKRFNLPIGKKYKSNVLEYKKDYSGYHPTQKPLALLKNLIKTYTNSGDIILDFCMGSGTTGVACKILNRDFIGIELDKEYFDIAKQRCENTQHNKQMNAD